MVGDRGDRGGGGEHADFYDVGADVGEDCGELGGEEGGRGGVDLVDAWGGLVGGGPLDWGNCVCRWANGGGGGGGGKERDNGAAALGFGGRLGECCGNTHRGCFGRSAPWWQSWRSSGGGR